MDCDIQKESQNKFIELEKWGEGGAGVWYDTRYVLGQWWGGGGEGLVNAALIVGGGEVGHADQCFKRIDLLPGSSSVNWE